MKTLSLFLLLTTSYIFPQADYDILAGYLDGELENMAVQPDNSSAQLLQELDELADLIDHEYDFHENVSYVGEDPDEVMLACNLSYEETEELLNTSEVYIKTAWNAVVDVYTGEPKYFILYLFADLEVCQVQRGVFVINLDGYEVNSDYIWEEFQIDFSDFLAETYIEPRS